MSRLTLIVVIVLLLVGPTAVAAPPIRITAAQVGFPSNELTRFGCWAPVYLELEILERVTEPAELVIQAPDPDGMETILAVPANLAAAQGRVSLAELGTIGYVRPAGSGEVTLTLRALQSRQPLADPFRIRNLRPRDPLTYVVLAVGSPQPGFELPKPAGASAERESAGLRGGRVELAAITDLAQLPDQWFGYEAADLVILNTSNREFLTQLTSDAAQPKRAALMEWVRRGGRLVVAVGTNANLFAQRSALQDVLPYRVAPTTPIRDVKSLVLYWNAREGGQTSSLSGALGLGSGTFPVAHLVAQPDRSARVLIPPPERLKENDTVIAAQAALGLGKVTVIAFDLDRDPFARFAQRVEFWDWILREGGANRASGSSDSRPRAAATTISEEEDELAVALRTHTDTFEGIPVVSFGWVAVLIVLYLLLIGPVEYYFLRRVLGRLELTWITFPLIVLTVSLLAYYTADSLKGRELRINKTDILDVDPASGRVYGTTWFTIFSPRITEYTLAVTPGEGWAKELQPSGTVVSWIGSPRGGQASLLQRRYNYHTGDRGLASGLEQVPIQVWSTKSFVANWSSPIGPAELVESRLSHPPGDPEAVIGTIVNRLPVPVLSDCMLFYAGQAYPLPGGTLHSGDTVRVVLDKGTLATQWLQKESGLESVLLRVPAYAERPGASRAAAQSVAASSPKGVAFPLWGLLFHEAALPYAEGVVPRNASLRRLDQSWRLTPANRNEVILVGRATPPIGPSEDRLAGPDSPSRLWLTRLPGSNTAREPISGTGRQETWVRVYLPVR
jgi:hypothetical protein